ncbi:MAG: FixH family protein [Flavobacteriales bacterium]
MKKKKFNWATGIFLAYSAFVALIVVMVVSTYQQNIDLVTPNYYEQELKYQQRQAELIRSSQLQENVLLMMNNQVLILKFPQGKTVAGQVELFRPSDKRMDVQLPITTNSEGEMLINKSPLKSGMYKVLISWIMDDISYFNEETIVIP